MLHPIQSSSIDWVIDTACRNAARSGVRQGVQETSQGDAQVKDKGRTLRFQLPWLVVESTSGSGRPPEKTHSSRSISGQDPHYGPRFQAKRPTCLGIARVAILLRSRRRRSLVLLKHRALGSWFGIAGSEDILVFTQRIRLNFLEQPAHTNTHKRVD